jgi:hypothetical protein
MTMRRAVVALAAAAALLPTPSGLVDRLYSPAYRVLQGALTSASNVVELALIDLLIVLVFGAWLVLAIGDLARRRRDPAVGVVGVVGRIGARTVVWAAVIYVSFLALWGLNYRRTPLVDRLPFDSIAVTADAARSMAFTAAEQLNGLYETAHRIGWPEPGAIDPMLAQALRLADRETGGAGTLIAARPKPTLLDWYFRRTATQGMTDPFFLETLVADSLLPFERPFVVAHEWSHLAGLADEGDASFLAWLACVRATPPVQYSGWLFLYTELLAVLERDTRNEVAARLEAGPTGDLAAIRARIARQLDPRLAAASRRVYDQYLKANRIESGVESYAHVVRLVLGVRFGPGWTLAPVGQEGREGQEGQEGRKAWLR